MHLPASWPSRPAKDCETDLSRASRRSPQSSRAALTSSSAGQGWGSSEGQRCNLMPLKRTRVLLTCLFSEHVSHLLLAKNKQIKIRKCVERENKKKKKNVSIEMRRCFAWSLTQSVCFSTEADRPSRLDQTSGSIYGHRHFRWSLCLHVRSSNANKKAQSYRRRAAVFW